MGSHPINLAVRFLLELIALVIMGIWGWRQGEEWMSFVLAIGIPLFAAVVWGVFAVSNDPSRSGSAPVETPGVIRLAIEIAIFSFATWALFDLDLNNFGWIFGIIVTLHYIISYDRILWLLRP